MPHLEIGRLIVDRIADTSAVFQGTNRLTGWSHRQKLNEGFGQTAGGTEMENSQSRVTDRDLIDRHDRG